MRLLPAPAHLGAALANAYDATFGGGLADLRPMPASLVERGPRHALHRYLPLPSAWPGRGGDSPVLLIPPLGAPSTCFDLRRGCSLVEHLLQSGRAAYGLGYGPVDAADPSLELGSWVEEVLPGAIRRASEDAGGAPVHLVAWGLGGVMALFALAADRDAPVASAALVAAPFESERVPRVPPRPARRLARTWAVVSSSSDRDALAEIDAVNRFEARMQAHPGPLHHRLLDADDLAEGRLRSGGRTLESAGVRAPVLAIAGDHDQLAPAAACHHVAPLLPRALVRLATAPGGHLGVLTGRAARTTTWIMLDEWLDGHAASPVAGRPRRDAEAA